MSNFFCHLLINCGGSQWDPTLSWQQDQDTWMGYFSNNIQYTVVIIWVIGQVCLVCWFIVDKLQNQLISYQNCCKLMTLFLYNCTLYFSPFVSQTLVWYHCNKCIVIYKQKTKHTHTSADTDTAKTYMGAVQILLNLTSKSDSATTTKAVCADL